MKDEIQHYVSSAYQLVSRIREQAEREAAAEARLDRRAKESSIRLEVLLDEQSALLREANERAALMELRAEESDKGTKIAKRHAVLANIIAIIALALTALQYLSGD